MNTPKAQYKQEVELTDPDTGNKVLMSIYKDSKTGMLLGLESSFTDVLYTGEVINSPYNNEVVEIINE